MAKRDDPEVEILRLILKRNPDVPLSELGDTLEKVGVSTEDGGLDRLIAASGYVVVDEDGTERLRPRAAEPARAASTPPAAPAAASAAGTGRAKPPFPANPSATVAITILGLLLLTVVGLTIVRHDNSHGSSAAATATTVALPTTLPGARTTTTLAVAPVGPGSDPQLAVSGAVTDSFAQPGPLGPGPQGHAWKVWQGSWTVAGGVATVSGGPSGGLNLATINLGTSDVRAQVKLTNDEAGAALAFRVVDAKNYWLVASAPQFGTFTVIQIVNGKTHYRANSGVTKGGPGTTIGVNAFGTSIQIYVNGAIVARIDDPHPQGDSLGLGTAVKENKGSFSDLIYLVK